MNGAFALCYKNCEIVMKQKRKNILAYFLLAVSILVLTVTVFPHHHHDLHFCPITFCEQCHSWSCSCEHETSEDFAHHHTGDQSCKTTCVTQFHYLTPSDSHHNTGADYTFFTFIYPLLHQLEILFRAEDSPEPDIYYLEKLHTQLFTASVGLRAPPFMVLS